MKITDAVELLTKIKAEEGDLDLYFVADDIGEPINQIGVVNYFSNNINLKICGVFSPLSFSAEDGGFANGH